MTRQQVKERGFTIIEVVLVLAIAALIFLMVFLALPALQSSQRDTARKNDVSIVASAMTTYRGNNRQTTPDAAQLKTYLTNLSSNSSSDNVTVNTSKPTSVTATEGAITVVTGMKCGSSNGAAMSLTTGLASGFATITRLEAGNGSAYCLDS
jgi:prepilin-type N-terminal cleavage/methylation domain-containing protein